MIIIKRFDKKHLQNILKSLSDNYITIQIQDKSKEVIIKDSKQVTIIQSK